MLHTPEGWPADRYAQMKHLGEGEGQVERGHRREATQAPCVCKSIDSRQMDHMMESDIDGKIRMHQAVSVNS